MGWVLFCFGGRIWDGGLLLMVRVMTDFWGEEGMKGVDAAADERGDGSDGWVCVGWSE